MSEDQAIAKQFRTPVILIRASAVLFVGLAAGHLSAYPWLSGRSTEVLALQEAMNSAALEFVGQRSSYWHIYFGWGILIALMLLAMAAILWLLAGFAVSSRQRVGLICGVFSATSLLSAIISLRYFFIPPFIFYLITGILLTVAAVLLSKRPIP